MNRIHLALLGILAIAFSPLLVGRAAPAAKTAYFTGKVVPLARVLEKYGAKLDAEAAPHWLGLLLDDGTVYPLIRDDGSRMFFTDERLLNRTMRLTGRLLPRTNLLQVVEVHSYHKGELHSVYYWCDICAIKRYEKKACDCCGGPMELREERSSK